MYPTCVSSKLCEFILYSFAIVFSLCQKMEHVGPFTGSGPNGGSRENCAVQSSASKWVDWTCSRRNGNGGRYFHFFTRSLGFFALWLCFSRPFYTRPFCIKVRVSAKQLLRQFWDFAGSALTPSLTPSSSPWTWTRTSTPSFTGEMSTLWSGGCWIFQKILLIWEL